MTPQEIVTELLDLIAANYDIEREADLAKLLDVSPVTLWRWRNDHLDKSTRVLLPFIWDMIAVDPEPSAA